MITGTSKVVASLPLTAFPSWNMYLMDDLLDILVLLAAALLYLSMACSRYPQVS
jgi:hypothetical protein